MNYEDLKRGIETCPMTFLPALLTVVAEEACRRKVFVAGGASRVVRGIEAKHGIAEQDARRGLCGGCDMPNADCVCDVT